MTAARQAFATLDDLNNRDCVRPGESLPPSKNVGWSVESLRIWVGRSRYHS